MAAKSFAGFSIVSFNLRGLFAAAVGKHLCAVGETLLSIYVVCVSFSLYHLLFAVNCIAVFTRFRALEEKTNKHMSSVSFIAGQPVINASAVVSLRRCRLICLSLSKTCLCGPFRLVTCVQRDRLWLGCL